MGFLQQEYPSLDKGKPVIDEHLVDDMTQHNSEFESEDDDEDDDAQYDSSGNESDPRSGDLESEDNNEDYFSVIFMQSYW